MGSWTRWLQGGGGGGGGANGNAWPHGHGKEEGARGSFCHVCLNVCSPILHLFIAARFFAIACVFGELANLDALFWSQYLPLFVFNNVIFMQ